MNPLKERIMRLDWIVKICKEPMNEEYVLAQIGVVHGLSRRTATEYMTQLVGAGKLEREGPNVRAAK